MKKLAKISAFILALSMVIACAGCGKDSGTKTSPKGDGQYKGKPEQKYIDAGKEIPFKDLGGQEINIVGWWDPKPQPKGTSEAADALWERIEYLQEEYNCKIKFTSMLQSEIIPRMVSGVESGKPSFDFAYVLTSQLPSLMTKKYLQPLEDVKAFDFKAEKWSQYNLSIGKYKNNTYTLGNSPVSYPRQVVFFNKKMFKDNNWTSPYELYEKDNWTWSEMLKIAQAATKDTDGDNVPNVYGLSGYGDLMQYQMILSNDAELVSINANNEPVFSADSPKSMEAIQFLVDLRNKYKVVNEPEAPTWDGYVKDFKEGKTAMMFMELYMAQNMRDMTDDFGIVVPPKGPQAKTYASRYGDHPIMVMPANNPKVQEASFIFDLLYDPLDGFTDDWKTEYETFLRDEESIQMVKTISDKYAKFDNCFFYVGARAVIDEAINQAVGGNKTTAEAMQGVKNRANTVLKDQYQNLFE